MPTEHEYKFCVSLSIADKFKHESLKELCHEWYQIKQGYLAFSKGTSTRIRSTINQFGKEKWFFTFKQKVGNRIVEIEKKLSTRDGVDLWTKCVGKLNKTRYVFKEKGLIWELDYFKNGEHLYFVQLEVEMNEGADRPKSLPSFLNGYILYEVPLTDDRFSNKRLVDVDYANYLYNKISEGTIDEETE